MTNHEVRTVLGRSPGLGYESEPLRNGGQPHGPTALLRANNEQPSRRGKVNTFQVITALFL